MATPKPPRNLGDRGRELWDSIIPTYQLKADEIQILIDACREADLIERLHDALVNGDLISSGYNGQDVPSPSPPRRPPVRRRRRRRRRDWPRGRGGGAVPALSSWAARI
jgi:hypothetical protein